MEVVEKSLYVKEEEGSDMSGLDAGLCRVCHGKDGGQSVARCPEYPRLGSAQLVKKQHWCVLRLPMRATGSLHHHP